MKKQVIYRGFGRIEGEDINGNNFSFWPIFGELTETKNGMGLVKFKEYHKAIWIPFSLIYIEH